MWLTIVLGLAGCALLFFGIWGVTVTMPTKLLAKNFPEDVQEALKPRLDTLSMSFRRIVGWVILVLVIVGYISLFAIGGLDGKANGFTFGMYVVRFFVIGAMIKAFDIIGLDYFLLTKTNFFPHYFPETKGLPGWQDFGYNRKQQLRQIAMLPIGCIVMAWIFTSMK